MLYKIRKLINLMYTKKRSVRLGGLGVESPDSLRS